MTIEEAIQHCMDIAETQEMCSNGKKCAEEHRQLAEWLKELKALKEQTDTLNKIRAEIDNAKLPTNQMSFFRDGINYALQIIDKYKAESEVQDADSN